MKEWKEYKIGDVFAYLKSGKGIHANEISSKGEYPVFGGNGLRGYTTRKNFEGDCAIIGRQGAFCGNVRYFKGKAYMTEHAIIAVANENNSTRFLAYLLSIMNLGRFSGQSAQPGLSVTELAKQSITIPSLSVQKKIATILSSLDDKIELNRRINRNLEQQAQALFKAWFVDFEPFKNGKFVDSELGKIPEGWKVVELGKVTKHITERVGQKNDIKVLSPITTGELVLSEEYFTKQVFSENIAKYIIVKPKQFAYNPARVNIGSLGMNTFTFTGCVSPVYVVFECENRYEHFFDCLRKTKSFKEEVISRAIGGVRQSLGYKDFSLIKTIYPPKQVIIRFNELYLKLLQLRRFNIKENDSLSSLRDTLLPKLMSGELNVNTITE